MSLEASVRVGIEVDAAEDLEDVVDTLQDTGKEAKKASKQVDKFADVTDDTAKEAKDASNEMEDMTDAFEDVEDSAKDGGEAVEEFGETTEDAADESADAFDDVTDAVDETADAVETGMDDSSQAVEGFVDTSTDGFEDVAGSTGDVEGAFEDVEAVTTDTMAASGESVQGFAETAETGFDTAVSSTEGVGQAFVDVEATTGTAMDNAGTSITDFADIAETGMTEVVGSTEGVGQAFTDNVETGIEGSLTNAATSITDFSDTSQTEMDEVIASTEGVGDSFEAIATDSDSALGSAETNVTDFSSTVETEMGDVTSAAEGASSAFDGIETGSESALSGAETNVTDFSSTVETEMDDVVFAADGASTAFDGIESGSETSLASAETSVTDFSGVVETEMDDVIFAADGASTAFDGIQSGSDIALAEAETNVMDFSDTVEFELGSIPTTTDNTSGSFETMRDDITTAIGDTRDEVGGFVVFSDQQLAITGDITTNASGNFVDMQGDVTTAMDTAGGSVGDFATDTDTYLDQAVGSTTGVGSAFVDVAGDVGTAMDDAGVSVSGFATDAESAMSQAEGSASTVGGAFTSAETEISDAMGNAGFSINDFVSVAQGGLSDVDTAMDTTSGNSQTFASDIESDFGSVESSVSTHLGTVNTDLGTFDQALSDASGAALPLVDSGEEVADTLSNISIFSGDAGGNMNTYATALINARTPQDQLKTSSDQYNASIGLAGVSMGIVAGSAISLATSFWSLDKMQLAAERSALKVETAQKKLADAEAKLRGLQESGVATTSQLAAAEAEVASARAKLELVTKKNEIVQKDLGAAFVQFYTSIAPATIGMIGGIINIYDDFKNSWGNIKSVVSSIVGGFNAFVAGLKGQQNAATGAVGANVAYQASVKPIPILNMQVGTTATAGALGMGRLGTAALAAGGALRTAGLAMKAFITNPVGLILTAIGTAMALVSTNAFGFRDALQGAGKAIGDMLPFLKPVLEGIEELGRAVGLVPEKAEAMATAVDGSSVKLDELGKKNLEIRETNLKFIESVTGVANAARMSDAGLQAAVNGYNKYNDEATKTVAANFDLVASVYGFNGAIGLTDEALAAVTQDIRDNAIAGKDTKTSMDNLANAYFETGRQLEPLLGQLGVEVDLSKINAQTGWDTARSKYALVKAYDEQIQNTIGADDALRQEVASLLISQGRHQEAADAVLLQGDALDEYAEKLGISREEVEASAQAEAQATREREASAAVNKVVADSLNTLNAQAITNADANYKAYAAIRTVGQGYDETAVMLDALRSGGEQWQQTLQKNYHSLVEQATALGYVGDASTASAAAMAEFIAEEQQQLELNNQTTESFFNLTDANQDLLEGFGISADQMGKVKLGLADVDQETANVVLGTEKYEQATIDAANATEQEAVALALAHPEFASLQDVLAMTTDEQETFIANTKDSDAALAEAENAVRELTSGFENQRQASQFLLQEFGLLDEAAGFTAEEMYALAQSELQLRQEASQAHTELVAEARAVGYVGDTSKASTDKMIQHIAAHEATADAAAKTTEEVDAETQALLDNAQALNELNPNLTKTHLGYRLIADGAFAVSEEGKRMMTMFQDLDQQWDSNIEQARELAIVNGVDVVDAYKMTDEELVNLMLTSEDLITEQKTLAETAQEAAETFAEEWNRAFDDYKGAIDEWAGNVDSAFKTVGQELGKELEVIGGEAKEKFSKGIAFNDEFWDKAFPEGVARNAINGSLDIPGLISDTRQFLDDAVGEGLITRQQAEDWFEPMLDYIENVLPDDMEGGMGIMLAAMPEMFERFKTTVIGGIAIGPDVKETIQTNIIDPVVSTLKAGGGMAEGGAAMVQHVRDILPKIRDMNPDVAAALEFALVDPATGLERPLDEQVKMLLGIFETIAPGTKAMVDDVDTNLNGIPDIIDTNMITPAEEMRLAWLESQRDIAMINGTWTQDMENTFQQIRQDITGVPPIIDDMGRHWEQTTQDVKGNADEMQQAFDNLIQDGWVDVADSAETESKNIIESADGSRRAILDFETNTITYLQNVSGQWVTTGQELGKTAKVAPADTTEFSTSLDGAITKTETAMERINRLMTEPWDESDRTFGLENIGGDDPAQQKKAGIKIPPPDFTEAEAAWNNHVTFVQTKVDEIGLGHLARLVQGYGLMATQIGIPFGGMMVTWTGHVTGVSAQVDAVIQHLVRLVQAYGLTSTQIGIPFGGMIVSWTGHVTGVSAQVDAVIQHLIRLVQAYGLTATQIGIPFGGMMTSWAGHVQGVSAQVDIIGNTHLARLVQHYNTKAQEIGKAFGGMMILWTGHVQGVSAQIDIIGNTHLARMVQHYTSKAQELGRPFGGIMTLWSGHVQGVSAQIDIIGRTHLTRLVQHYNTAGQGIGRAFGGIMTAWLGHARGVAAQVNTIGSTHLGRMVQHYNNSGQGVGRALGGIMTAWLGHVRGVQARIRDIETALNNMVNSISNAMNRTIGHFNRGIQGARNLQNAINALRGREIVVTTRYRTVGRPGAGVTRMQHGGGVVVDKPTTFLAGEAGAEFVHVVPLPKRGPGQIESIIEQERRTVPKITATAPRLEFARNTGFETAGGGGRGTGAGGRPIQVNLVVQSKFDSKLVGESARKFVLDGISGFV